MDRKEVKYLEQTACEIRKDVIHMEIGRAHV